MGQERVYGHRKLFQSRFDAYDRLEIRRVLRLAGGPFELFQVALGGVVG